jgi:hypothetical protein
VGEPRQFKQQGCHTLTQHLPPFRACVRPDDDAGDVPRRFSAVCSNVNAKRRRSHTERSFTYIRAYLILSKAQAVSQPSLPFFIGIVRLSKTLRAELSSRGSLISSVEPCQRGGHCCWKLLQRGQLGMGALLLAQYGQTLCRRTVYLRFLESKLSTTRSGKSVQPVVQHRSTVSMCALSVSDFWRASRLVLVCELAYRYCL